MQIAATTTNVTPVRKSTDVGDTTQTTLISSLSQYQIIRRNGAVVPFEPAKIAVAMMKAFWPCMAHKVQPLPACARRWIN